MRQIKFLSLILLVISFMSGARGAEVREIKDFLGAPVIDISGEIQSGDLNRIQAQAAKFILEQTAPISLRKSLRFQINTPGGDVLEAIKIGQFFREVLAGVQSYGKLIYAVGSKDEEALSMKRGDPEYEFLPIGQELDDSNIVRNHSSGILMFYGGVRRSHRDNSDLRHTPRIIVIPVMGIHRPYYSKEYYASLSPAQAQEAYARLENLVRAYLVQMGAPLALIDRMFMKASNEIDLIPAEDFRSFYKAEESFFQEWLLARCGAKGAEYVLVDPGLSDFRKIEKFQIRARLQNGPLTKPIGYLYPDPEFPLPYMEALYRQVRSNNAKVESCSATALNQHQNTWANSFVDRARRVAPKK